MAITKIWAIKNTVHKAIAYIENPAKTDHGLLVSAYNCSPDTAAAEFALTEQIASEGNRKGRRPKNPNRAYHLLQSFSPNDPVTPEQAHEMGRQLADRLLGGQYEYVISTHIDKNHIHNHIIINATSWITGQKLRTQPYKTAFEIRAISDQICVNHDLSVIQQPSDLGYSYKEWSERKENNSWKAELRKRLNFVLARATSYDEFLSMCRELDVAVDDSRRDMHYELRDASNWPTAKRIRGKGKKSLSDTDRYTKTGIQEQVTENAEEQEILWSAIMEEIGQTDSWEELLNRLERNHEIKITQGKLGLIYHLPDGLKRKELELGAKFSKEQLLRALGDHGYIPGDEPSPSIREKWDEATKNVRKKDVDEVPIRLKAENIEKISLEGLLIRVPYKDSEVSVFVNNDHVDFDSGTKEYTAYLTSEYSYYAVKENPDPDLPESEQLSNVEIRGEDVIRGIEKQNGVEGRWVDVPTEYIRSIRPDKVVLFFEGVCPTGVTVGADDMKVSPDRLRVRIHDHWSYGRNFKGDEMRTILERAEEPAIDQMWRKYRAYLRNDQRQQVRILTKTLNVMDREGIQGLKHFPVQRQKLSGEIEARNAHLRLLRQKKEQYTMAYRYLEAVQRHGLIYERASKAKGWAKQKLETAHQQELELYRTALKNLEAMHVQATVDPEKVRGMMDNLDDEIRRCQAELRQLDKRIDDMSEAEMVVREILGADQEDQRDDRQQEQETKDQRSKITENIR